MKREDDFKQRRKHLENLSEKELENKFWELAEKIMDPIVELAEKNTTPSIERSVIMRMGFSSIESKAIVEGVMDRGLMGKGAGNVIYKLSKDQDLGIRETGLKLLDGELWDRAIEVFNGGESHES
ncbi:ornithine aminomutase subunit alpha [Senegalia massiliensis]|uniref:Ornithine aminomutase n=1 Tax=Senegalia massiliensis TaxID=1720316 RepID=A0A845QZX0_9CLOT|nr:ornithine aminomutase subunit alpha [Senegalia massiliensis]NBI06732.1 ornithine aminomutase [Senegalia massiliensis]